MIAVNLFAVYSAFLGLAMNGAGKKNISTFRKALQRLLAEYKNFDAARRLCADYCITAHETSLLGRDIKHKPKFLVDSEQDIEADDAYLMAR